MYGIDESVREMLESAEIPVERGSSMTINQFGMVVVLNASHQLEWCDIRGSVDLDEHSPCRPLLVDDFKFL